MSLELFVKPARLFDTGHRRQFEKLVLSGGQVMSDGLPERVASAHYLAFLTVDGEPVGTNAVKNNRVHQRTIERDSGVELADDEYLGEVGWLYVVKAHRRIRLGDLLTSAILASAGGHGLFATIQSKNIGARLLHERHGFYQVGKSWPSSEQKDMVSLYIRGGRRG